MHKTTIGCELHGTTYLLMFKYDEPNYKGDLKGFRALLVCDADMN